jgi:hypothetical protein
MKSPSRRSGRTSARGNARARLRALAIAVAALTSTSGVLANGRFPAANLFVFDPGDQSHVVASTTFGLLESNDGAKSFGWICEAALGIAGQQDTMVALTGRGVLVAATFDGIVTSGDGCGFTFAPELAGKIVPDLSLSRSTPDEVLAFHMIGLSNDQFESQIVRSSDDGRTWTNVGPLLPLEVLPLSIDIAPADRLRVYVSGRLGAPDGYASVLMRSTDGGLTFDRTLVPDTNVDRMSYIAAVHPNDPDRVYLRTDDTRGTVVWSSEDGGKTLGRRFTGSARLPGFAISPDGTLIAVGGPDDGTWVADTDGTAFDRRSDVGPTCLAWNDEGLYACADARQAGFSLGVSRDRATTFEPLLQFASQCGRTTCGAGTDVGKLCPDQWTTVGAALGTSCSDAGADEAGRDGTTPDAGATEAGQKSPPEASGGCSLAEGRGKPRPFVTWVFASLFARLARLARRARRARSSR